MKTQPGLGGGRDALYWAEWYWLGSIKISLTNSFSNLIVCCPHNWMGKREVESLKRSKLNRHQEKIPILCVCAILCIVAPWLYIEHALFDSPVLNSLFIKDSCLQTGAFSIQLAWRRSSLAAREAGLWTGGKIRKGKPMGVLAMQESGGKQNMFSFHVNILIKDCDEEICFLFFLGRSSVCREVRPVTRGKTFKSHLKNH